MNPTPQPQPHSMPTVRSHSQNTNRCNGHVAYLSLHIKHRTYAPNSHSYMWTNNKVWGTKCILFFIFIMYRMHHIHSRACEQTIMCEALYVFLDRTGDSKCKYTIHKNTKYKSNYCLICIFGPYGRFQMQVYDTCKNTKYKSNYYLICIFGPYGRF